jgi:glycolate oxidase iron-sulfur subunit
MAGAAVPTPRFLADVYEAASECNKCSLCQATCPAYVVNPVEWETARGRIALIRDAMEGRLELRDIAEGPLSSCLTCDNCVAACAPRVPTGHIVSRARQELHAQEGYPWGQSFALRTVLPRPGALRALHGFARFTRRTGLYGLASRIGLLSWLGTLGALAEQSGPPPDKTVYQMLADLPPAAEPVRGSVAMLVCCLSNLTVPEATDATIRVLLASGYEVQVPQLGCSGLPARTLGDRDAMIDMAVRNSSAMSNLDVDAYLGDSASCTEHYREYGSIAGDDRQVGARARDIAHHTAQASDFLDRNGVRGDLGPLRWRVAIDEPCALPIDGPERGAMHRLLASRHRAAQRAGDVLRRSGLVFCP